MFSYCFFVYRKYDFKGFLVFWEVSDKEKVKELFIFKDMDFFNKNQKVYIGEEEKKIFLEKLKRDVEFLVQLKIMDYSFLLGIYDIIWGFELEEEVFVWEDELEVDGDCSLIGFFVLVGFYGIFLEGIGGYIYFYWFLGLGEFEFFIDVYVIWSVEGVFQKEVYFMGFIDIFIQYDVKKKVVYVVKIVKYGVGVEIFIVYLEQYVK